MQTIDEDSMEGANLSGTLSANISAISVEKPIEVIERPLKTSSVIPIEEEDEKENNNSVQIRPTNIHFDSISFESIKNLNLTTTQRKSLLESAVSKEQIDPKLAHEFDSFYNLSSTLMQSS